MKQAFLIAALAAALVAPAYASGNTCIGNANCSTTNNDNDPITNTASAAATASPVTTNTNVNTAVGGAGGKGGEGGDALAIGVGIGKGGNASVDKSGNSFNVNDNDQSQSVRVKNEQDQSQKQKQYQTSTSKAGVYGSGNSSTYVDASERNPRNVASAATVYAAPSPIVCSMPRGASAQGLTFGAALSFGDDDNECNRRAAAAMFYAQNNKVMGDSIMCGDEMVAEAAKRLADAGQPNACYAVEKAE